MTLYWNHTEQSDMSKVNIKLSESWWLNLLFCRIPLIKTIRPIVIMLHVVTQEGQIVALVVECSIVSANAGGRSEPIICWYMMTVFREDQSNFE